ncbi:hypothetical protein N474_06735 [Pseudoalteromonas luteoviolacea CPMOR-2]|nr:hypothetical protein N474_06735 [Pseudoalteromonas luteoviolacea CPMOR-2]
MLLCTHNCSIKWYSVFATKHAFAGVQRVVLTNLLLVFHHIEEKMTALSNFKKARLFHKKTCSSNAQSRFLNWIYQSFTKF